MLYTSMDLLDFLFNWWFRSILVNCQNSTDFILYFFGIFTKLFVCKQVVLNSSTTTRCKIVNSELFVLRKLIIEYSDYFIGAVPLCSRLLLTLYRPNTILLDHYNL